MRFFLLKKVNIFGILFILKRMIWKEAYEKWLKDFTSDKKYVLISGNSSEIFYSFIDWESIKKVIDWIKKQEKEADKILERLFLSVILEETEDIRIISNYITDLDNNNDIIYILADQYNITL